MAIFEVSGAAASTALNVGLVLLIVPLLAEWAKIRKGSEKAYNWIAAGGISFILAASIGASGVLGRYAAQAAESGWLLFDAVGVILVFFGALMVLWNYIGS